MADRSLLGYRALQGAIAPARGDLEGIGDVGEIGVRGA